MNPLRKLAVLLVAACEIAAAQTARFTLPETGKTISIKFQADPESPGDFRSFDIDTWNKRFHFVPKEVVTRFPATREERIKEGFWVDIPGLKIDPSRYFLVGKYGTDSAPHSLLLFVSKAFASDASALLVIGFTASGDPYKVLEREYLDVTSFLSLDDGTAQIIGKDALSEVMTGDGGSGPKDPYATTYDPFSIFVLKPGEKAVYSLEASKSYNQKHYVWAGPHFREDYAVLFNIPGHHKPFGAPATKVDTLIGGKK